MRSHRCVRTIVGLCVGVVLGCGCSLSSKVTVAAAGSSPAGSFTPGLATVPVGVVLGFGVSAEGVNAITAAVDDSELVTVVPTVQGGQFVLIGLATGQTTLRIFAGDQEQTELPVQVIASAL